ncbi:hypothetical protein ABPG74_002157 [Tetrahymena malaccensis]
MNKQFDLQSLNEQQLDTLKGDLTNDLQDKVYDAVAKQKSLITKGQRFSFNRTINLSQNGITFQFKVEISGQLTNSYTYQGTISTSASSNKGWYKSDTISISQSDIENQSIFKKIWNWIKSIF